MKIKRATNEEKHIQLSPDRQFRADPEIEKKYGVKLKIVVERSDRYDKDYSKHYSVEKKAIKALKKDILNGHLYYDGPEGGGDTHHLEKYSKDGEYHAESKSINSIDRLNYLVYPPRLFEDENGNIRYEQKVVLTSCKEHYRFGVGNYSETEE